MHFFFNFVCQNFGQFLQKLIRFGQDSDMQYESKKINVVTKK